MEWTGATAEMIAALPESAMEELVAAINQRAEWVLGTEARAAERERMSRR